VINDASNAEVPVTRADAEACGAFWKHYLSHLPPGHPHHAAKPDAFAFGGAGALGQELAELVLSNQKRATTSLPIEFTSLNEALPTVGSVSIILDGALKPVAIIERTSVQFVSFEAVDAEYAAIEGEGDGSLAYWREGHIGYFNEVCSRLGSHFNHQTPVVCQTFRRVWPPGSAYSQPG
jgi:uncharacterized protein YhfF